MLAVTTTQSLGIVGDWCQGGRTVEVKTLERPWELGLALPPAVSVTAASPPAPERWEELPRGNGAWCLKDAREKVQTPAPGSTW